VKQTKPFFSLKNCQNVSFECLQKRREQRRQCCERKVVLPHEWWIPSARHHNAE